MLIPNVWVKGGMVFGGRTLDVLGGSGHRSPQALRTHATIAIAGDALQLFRTTRSVRCGHSAVSGHTEAMNRTSGEDL